LVALTGTQMNFNMSNLSSWKNKNKTKNTPLKANHVTSKLNIISSLRHNVSINVSEFPVTQDYTNEQLRV